MQLVATHIRLTQVNKQWVETRAREDDISQAAIINALCDEARTDGCTFRANPAQVIRP